MIILEYNYLYSIINRVSNLREIIIAIISQITINILIYVLLMFFKPFLLISSYNIQIIVFAYFESGKKCLL